MEVTMMRRRPWSLSTGRWSALLALAAALALLAAVACGNEGDESTDAGSAATTETTDAAQTSAGGDAATTTDPAPEPGPAVGHSIGDLAPDFTVDTIAGESFALSEVTTAGSPVLLYFFTTW